MSAVCETEFRASDGSAVLELSVYQLAGVGDVVKACAEHAASIPLDPKSTVNVDLQGLTPPPLEAPGAGRFAFTREAHRNVVLPSEAALAEAVGALLADRENRVHVVDKQQLKAYIVARREAGDAEWIEFLAEATCPEKWKRLCG